MTNPYRAMCAELVAEIEKWQQADDEFSDAGTIRADANYDLAPRARALLDQPEPEEPTDEDLEDLAEVMNVSGNPVPAMRRALELWGCQ
jgi:hypothetical protein